MKNFFTLIFLASFSAALHAAPAAKEKITYPSIPAPITVEMPNISTAEAKAQETGSDYIVFVYGAPWDYISTEYQRRIWAQYVTLSKLTPGTITTTMSMRENPTPQEREDDKAANGTFNESVRTLPAVFMMHASGLCYATLSGARELPYDAQALSETLAKLQQQGQRRAALLALAEQAEGMDKANLLGQALVLDALTRPPALLNALQAADLNEETPYSKRLFFRVEDLHPYIAKNPGDGEAIINKMVEDAAYTPLQKQEMLGVLTTILRRHGGSRSNIDATLRRIQELAPDSLYGKAAEQLLRNAKED